MKNKDTARGASVHVHLLPPSTANPHSQCCHCSLSCLHTRSPPAADKGTNHDGCTYYAKGRGLCRRHGDFWQREIKRLIEEEERQFTGDTPMNAKNDLQLRGGLADASDATATAIAGSDD